jgi:hypothetical protein
MEVARPVDTLNITKSFMNIVVFMKNISIKIFELTKHSIYYTDLKIDNIGKIGNVYCFLDIGSICILDRGIYECGYTYITSNKYISMARKEDTKIKMQSAFSLWYLLIDIHEKNNFESCSIHYYKNSKATDEENRKIKEENCESEIKTILNKLNDFPKTEEENIIKIKNRDLISVVRYFVNLEQKLILKQ